MVYLYQKFACLSTLGLKIQFKPQRCDSSWPTGEPALSCCVSAQNWPFISLLRRSEDGFILKHYSDDSETVKGSCDRSWAVWALSLPHSYLLSDSDSDFWLTHVCKQQCIIIIFVPADVRGFWVIENILLLPQHTAGGNRIRKTNLSWVFALNSDDNNRNKILNITFLDDIYFGGYVNIYFSVFLCLSSSHTNVVYVATCGHFSKWPLKWVFSKTPLIVYMYVSKQGSYVLFMLNTQEEQQHFNVVCPHKLLSFTLSFSTDGGDVFNNSK